MHSSYFTLKTIRNVLVFKITALACPEVEVFTGPIFSPNSSPPHEPGSKSIPPQIQNLMGQPTPIHIKVSTVFTRIVLKY